MSLGKKLARLQKPVSGAIPSAGSDAGRADTLDELRSKMDSILGRERPPPRPPANPSETSLPFAPVAPSDTVTTTVHYRHERLAPSHHVGRIPVDAARSATAEMLALLALDPVLGDVDVEHALFLDTETTGLGGGSGTIAFLVGLLRFDGSAYALEQLLLRSPAEEPAMLEVLSDRIASASMLVTYNGKSFDWPLLETRFVMNGRPVPPLPPHFDLLHVARRLHSERIGKCSLKAIESRVLGFERGDDIDGVEVAPRYAHFLRTGDEGALAAVVEHNVWDIVSMAALTGLYGEPLTGLHDDDLLGLARTMKRAKAFDQADAAATRALDRGVGPAARELRGRIAKARGDKQRALGDFEALAAEVDDATVRLELAKLYEHHVREPARALALVEQGTGETEEAVDKRRARLERKLAREPKRRRGR